MIPDSLPQMNDEQKLQLVIALIETMPLDFKNAVVQAISENNATGETQVTVESNEQFVKINFGRPLAWFVIPKEHALALGISLMQHSGAKLEQVERPKPDERN